MHRLADARGRVLLDGQAHDHAIELIGIGRQIGAATGEAYPQRSACSSCLSDHTKYLAASTP